MQPDPAERAAAAAPLLDRLISRDNAVVGVCLALMAALAWLWLIAGAPAAHGPMTGHEAMEMATPAVWSAGYLLPAFAMWALMMVAMMLPAAAPMILLYARVARQPGGAGTAGTALFVSTYLAIWILFAAGAALLQAALIGRGIVDSAALAVGERRLAGAVLLLAALYQLSPAKRACLDQCRSPLTLILRLSRPGLAGALRLGVAHGLYCLGCCWALMLLLFVGGVMNLAWIAGLSLVVLIEKLAPPALRVRPALAAALTLAGAYLMI